MIKTTATTLPDDGETRWNQTSLRKEAVLKEAVFASGQEKAENNSHIKSNLIGEPDARMPEGRGLTFWCQLMAANGVLSVLLYSLVLQKNTEIDPHYRAMAIFVVLGTTLIYSFMKVYHKQDGYLVGLGRLFYAWVFVLLALVAVAFVTKASGLFSREVFLTWAVLGFVLQAGLYLPLQNISRRYHQKLQSTRISLIIGTGELALSLADKLVRNKREPLIGLVAVDRQDQQRKDRYPILGSLENLRELIVSHRISRLYIALPLTADVIIEDLYFDLLDANVDVIWLPGLNRMRLLNQSVGEIERMPAIHLNESPLTAHPTAALSKVMMDRILALLLIIVFSPVLLATSIAVKFSSPGPVLFKQKRHGWNGAIINVWKFRSMRLHDDQQVKQASREDTRITRVGRFIRRTSIDELPQLFNVLQGQMSLVGPRPHAVAHNDYYTGKINAYMARHRIKPGMTGLAQVSGCRGETETLEKMAKRVDLDLTYINNWSLWLDVKILIKTPFTLLSKDIY